MNYSIIKWAPRAGEENQNQEHNNPNISNTSSTSVATWWIEEDVWGQAYDKISREILVKSNENYYTYENGEFIRVDGTREDFEERSVNLGEIIKKDDEGEIPYLTLDKPSLVHMSDKESVNLSIKGYRDLTNYGTCDERKILAKNKTRIPIAYLKGYSSPQIVKPVDDIRLGLVSKVNSILMKVEDKDNKIRVLYSIDRGDTWLAKVKDEEGYANKKVDVNDEIDFKENGMTIETFNSIKEDWTDEIVSHSRIRFAYYLDIDDMEQVSKVDKLIINLDMYGYWESQRHEDTHKIGYSNEEIMVSLKENGTYKINYG